MVVVPDYIGVVRRRLWPCLSASLPPRVPWNGTLVAFHGTRGMLPKYHSTVPVEWYFGIIGLPSRPLNQGESVVSKLVEKRLPPTEQFN